MALVAAASAAVAQSNTTSVCDKYTAALFGSNNATNQAALVTAIVARAVIGNTSETMANIAVPGILNPNGTYNGTAVNLVPYFTGALKSSNRGGASGVSVNFLDGGGAAPLSATPIMGANNASSNQAVLVTHLVQYFGALLGCTLTPAYTGQASMYEVHKFMVLDPNELAYFITQVGLSASSFGASQSDVTAVGTALITAFDNRCGPATTIIPSQGAQLQSICTDPSCPLAANSSCTNQAVIAAPNSTTGTSTSGGSSPSGTATGTSPSAGTTSQAASAVRDAVSAAGLLGAIGAGVFALL